MLATKSKIFGIPKECNIFSEMSYERNSYTIWKAQIYRYCL